MTKLSSDAHPGIWPHNRILTGTRREQFPAHCVLDYKHERVIGSGDARSRQLDAVPADTAGCEPPSIISTCITTKVHAISHV